MSDAAIDRFRLSLQIGDFLELEFGQDSEDLVVTVFDPAESRIFELDSPLEPGEPERLLLWAKQTGGHLFVVEAFPAPASLEYQFVVSAYRPGSEQDHKRASAAQLTARAGELRRRGGAEDLRQSLKIYKEAASLFLELRDEPSRVECLFQIARMYLRRADYRSARGFYEELLRVSQHWEASTTQLVAHAGLGEALRRLGARDEARHHLRRAEAMARKLGKTHDQASALNNLGNLALAEGKLSEAERWYSRALPIWGDRGDATHEAITLSNLGEVYFASGEPEVALFVLGHASQQLERSGRTETLARLDTLMANAHLRLGNLEQSEELFEKALAGLAGAQRNPQRLAEVLDGQGRLLYEKQRYEYAEATLTQSLDLFRETGDRRGEAATLQNLAWTMLKIHRLGAAREFFHESLVLARETGHRRSEAATLLGLAQVERDHGDLWEALHLSQEALRVVERLRATTDRIDLRSALLASKQRYFDVAIDILMRLHEEHPAAGHARQAFEISEQARGRRLLDTLRAEVGSGEPHPRLQKRRDQARQQVSLTAQAHRDLVAEGPSQRIAAAEEILFDALNTYRQLEARVPVEGVGAMSPSQSVLSLSAIQDLLEDGTHLLHFALGEERSYLWIVSNDALISLPLPPAATLEAMATRTHFHFAKSGHRASGRRAEIIALKLSQVLFGQIIDQLDGRRLLIAPEGALAYIPFGALPRPDGSGLLLEDYEIVHLNSISAVARMRQIHAGRPLAAKTLAVVGDPVFGSGDPRLGGSKAPTENRLPTLEHLALERSLSDLGRDKLRRLRFAGRESQTILAFVPESKRFSLLGLEANKRRMTRSLLADYRIVHIATHGLLNSRYPELSGIALSMLDHTGRSIDGFLHVHEIQELDLRAELVVLSACETGLGAAIQGEGLVGLAHGFQRAGASRVIVSLWKVDDLATTVLMEHLYFHLLEEGRSPAASLRSAQLALQKSDQWQRPYHWAAFVLQGEWRPSTQISEAGVLESVGSF